MTVMLSNSWYPCVQESSDHPLHITLLHGWGVDQHCWSALIPELQISGNVQTVSLEYQHADVDSLCQQIQSVMAPASVLVGWSLGGMLAARVAAHFPEKVSGLVTLAANQQFVADTHWPHAMPANTFSAFYQSMQVDPEQTLKRFLGLIVQGDDKAREQRRYLRATQYLDDIIEGLEMLQQCHNRQDYLQIKCPVLQCFGEYDSLVPIEVMDQLQQQYPQHQYHKLDNTGHCLHYPAQSLAPVLSLFIQSLSVGR
jgi:pimeloyl-ACP methyl ester esterase